MEEELNGEEAQFPSVELAYEFVKPSYDWMLIRFEAVNNKIQNLLTFAVSITAALPLFTKAIFDEVNFCSGWFYSIIVFFAFLVIIGVIGMRIGVITLVHPEKLFNECLNLSNWEFRKTMIFWAGEHFNANNKIIDKKCLLRDIMIIFLLVEILFAIVWITTAS